MRLFHDSIWTAFGRCGFAAALPPYGPSLLRVSALTRGSRYREFGDWPFIHEEMLRTTGFVRGRDGQGRPQHIGIQTHSRTSCSHLRMAGL